MVMRISSDFSPKGKRKRGCCEDEQYPEGRVGGRKSYAGGQLPVGGALSWQVEPPGRACRDPVEGLNGVQASQGLTTDGAG